MNISDLLASANNTISPQPAAFDERAINELLARLGGGQQASSVDYSTLLQSMQKKQPKGDFLAELGDSLVRSSTKNPQVGNFGTLGLALSDMRNNKNNQEMASQEQFQRSLPELLKMATGQRDHGFNKEKEANDVKYKMGSLDEMIRSHKADEGYKQGALGLQQQQLGQSKYGNITIGDDGKPYALDSRTGAFTPLGIPDGVKFSKNRGGVGATKPINPNDYQDIQNLIANQFGGETEITPETLSQLTLEAVEEANRLGGDGAAGVQAVLKKYGGAKGTGFEGGTFSDWQMKKTKPPKKSGVNLDALTKKAKAEGFSESEIKELRNRFHD